ncbi:ATP6V0D1 isoform 11, partial [Pan troglodytes]
SCTSRASLSGSLWTSLEHLLEQRSQEGHSGQQVALLDQSRAEEWMVPQGMPEGLVPE